MPRHRLTAIPAKVTTHARTGTDAAGPMRRPPQEADSIARGDGEGKQGRGGEGVYRVARAERYERSRCGWFVVARSLTRDAASGRRCPPLVASRPRNAARTYNLISCS